jgi:hypothetical protein
MVIFFLLKEKRTRFIKKFMNLFYIKTEIEEYISDAKLRDNFISNNDPSSYLIFHILLSIIIYFLLILHASHNAIIKGVKIIYYWMIGLKFSDKEVEIREEICILIEYFFKIQVS